MMCPNCNKGELNKHISIKGFFIKKKQIIIYCSLCDYKNEHIFYLSKNDVIYELEKRQAKLELSKIEVMNTKKYNQSYEQIKNPNDNKKI